MFGFARRILLLTVTTAIGFGILSEALAMDLSKPLPKLHAKQILTGNSSHLHDDFDKAVDGDCSPLLKRLNKYIQNEKSEYAARIVFGEMYDRAICVPYDPAKAYENFKRAADMGGPYYYAITAWKHAMGHGAKKSKILLHESLILYLIRSAVHSKDNMLNHMQNLLKDRFPSDEMLKGVNWLIEKTKTNEGGIFLALSLIDGTGQYYDDTSLPVDRLAAKYFLTQLSFDSPKARYHLGVEHLKGTFGEKDKREGEMHLMWSAQCGYIPAMLELANLALTGKLGVRQSNRDVYGWYLMASENGANVISELEKAKQNIGSVSQIMIQKDNRFKVNMKRCQM